MILTINTLALSTDCLTGPIASAAHIYAQSSAALYVACERCLNGDTDVT